MISLAEINRVARAFQVPIEVIEKDYVINWILCCITNSKIKQDFVFYGRTAIKRIYFPRHRFSEDIDLLSTNKFAVEDLLQEFDDLSYINEIANLELQIDQDKIISTKNRIQLYVNYSGYEEIVGAPKEIRIDFMLGMEQFGEIAENKILESYSDLLGVNKRLSVMTLNTILGNKLGLLTDLTRNEPRDLFDIWFLLDHTNAFDFSFKKTCQAFKDKYGYLPTYAVLSSALKNKTIEKNWQIRLARQMADLPAFATVMEIVNSHLENLFC